MMAAAGLPEAAIELRGQVDDMAAFYRDIDVLVLSSRTEGFPNVVAEAMSHGKPVVTTDVGDAALVVGDTGVVVPPRNEQALAEGMSPNDGFGTRRLCGAVLGGQATDRRPVFPGADRNSL